MDDTMPGFLAGQPYIGRFSSRPELLTRPNDDGRLRQRPDVHVRPDDPKHEPPAQAAHGIGHLLPGQPPSASARCLLHTAIFQPRPGSRERSQAGKPCQATESDQHKAGPVRVPMLLCLSTVFE